MKTIQIKPLSFISIKRCLITFYSLAAISVWAGTFASPFTGANVGTLSGDANILSGGGLQLNLANDGSSGATVLANLDPGQTVQSFTITATDTTTNTGGSVGADGFGLYFAAPGVVPTDNATDGYYQSFENLPVGNGLALLFGDYAGTISIETGSTQFSTDVPRSAMVGNLSINFSYDAISGAVLNFTGSDANLYTVSVSEATLVSDGFNIQSGDVFTLGGRVGYPGATSADTHILDSLNINTVTSVPEPSIIAALMLGMLLVLPRLGRKIFAVGRQ